MLNYRSADFPAEKCPRPPLRRELEGEPEALTKSLWRSHTSPFSTSRQTTLSELRVHDYPGHRWTYLVFIGTGTYQVHSQTILSDLSRMYY